MNMVLPYSEHILFSSAWTERKASTDGCKRCEYLCWVSLCMSIQYPHSEVFLWPIVRCVTRRLWSFCRAHWKSVFDWTYPFLSTSVLCLLNTTAVLSWFSAPATRHVRDSSVERPQAASHLSGHLSWWQAHLLCCQRLLHHQMWVNIYICLFTSPK